MAEFQSIPWGRTTSADLKYKVMLYLREGIKRNEVVETIHNIKERVPDAEKVVIEALQTKFFEDGRNLLMHAAAYGSKRAFIALARAILERKTLGIAALVRQLRELDENGTPLLFHAAVSNSIKCLSKVLWVLKKILGVRGFDEQLRAIDHKGRHVLMFAVRSPSFKVYDRIVQELQNDSDPKRTWCRLIYQQDAIGRSLMHYAAEGNCPEILQEVVKQAKRESSRMFEELVSAADGKGRTPIMYILRDSYSIRKIRLACESVPTIHRPGWPIFRTSSEEKYQQWKEEDARRAKQRERKLDILLNEMEANEQLRRLTQPSTINKAESHELTQSNGRSHRDRLTALMHAARGGLSAFDLAVKKIEMLSGRSFSVIDSTFFNLALGSDNSDETRISRTGMLVEEAAIGGDLDVMERVVNAIDPSEVHQVLESINDRGSCLFTAAIKSCDKRMVKRTAELINGHYKNDSKKAWDRLRGNASEKSSLACAASMPATIKKGGREVFDMVLRCLWEAALNLDPENIDPKPTEEEYANTLLREELVVTREPKGRGKISPVSPLAGAVLQSNRVLFKRVYDAYKQYGGHWMRHQILDQLREETIQTQETPEAYTIANDGNIVINIPAQMWHTVAEAFEKARGDPSWVRWRDCFSRTVQTLAERGDIAQMRALVKEKFPLHTHIPVLLERIGDYEENIIETVTLVVVHASNPLVVWAGASRDIIKAEVSLPMFKSGLRRLRDRLDTLIIKLLDQLPHTVRGVGRELLGSDVPSNAVLSHAFGDLKEQRNRDRMIEYLGYVVVRWMLEPSLASGALTGGENDNSDMLDPLQHALDRGSNCLPFVNSALVLDYLHLKFWNALPSWMARNPLHDAIPGGFYSYVVRPAERSWLHTGAGELIRFLQGWDKAGDVLNIAELVTSFPHSTLLPGLQFTLAGMIGNPVTFFAVPFVRFIFELMSYIVMLGLFCASVSIQKSDEIPLQEWVFYIFVLGLLWREFLEFKQALPARPDVIEDKAHCSPEYSERRTVWGLLCPRRRVTKRRHRVASAISRYLFYDTWNILDTITIVVVAAAFVFRILALGEGWSADEQTSSTASDFSNNYVFSAQLCLSFSAPLLFSRVLFLSQIDGTLGPMTQVIWVMMSHLARFTVFLLVVMASFALAFHALFFTCEGLEPSLEDAFGTFGQSLLTMFESMLGSFDFDLLLLANECNRPRWAYEGGVFLLVGYMVIMAILLLNLLIAVMTTDFVDVLMLMCGNLAQRVPAVPECAVVRLKEYTVPVWSFDPNYDGYVPIAPAELTSSATGDYNNDSNYSLHCAGRSPHTRARAHSAVDAHAEEEFQLSRAKLILQTSRAVANGRLPAPCNLIGAAMGCLVDIPHAFRMLGYALGIFKEYEPTEPLPAGGPTELANGGRAKSNMLKNARTKRARTGPKTPRIQSVDNRIKPTNAYRFLESTLSPLQALNATPAPHATVSAVAPVLDSCTSDQRATASETDMSNSQNDEAFPSDSPADEKKISIKPFTTSYSWQTVEGGRDRLIFAFSMGVTAVVASAVLWVISTPWLAWRILRWFFPAGPNKPKGYTWDAGSAVVKILAWLLMLPMTLVYCCGCALASAFLWLWGFCSVFEWVYWRLTDGYREFVDRGYHFVLPGEERDNDWNKARDIAKARNYTQNSADSENFNVGPLLKMTTGMDVEQLALRIKLKEEEERLKECVVSSLSGTVSEIRSEVKAISMRDCLCRGQFQRCLEGKQESFARELSKRQLSSFLAVVRRPQHTVSSLRARQSRRKRAASPFGIRCR